MSEQLIENLNADLPAAANQESDNYNNATVLARGLLLLTTLVPLGLTLQWLDHNSDLANSWIIAQVRGQGWEGVLLFLLGGTAVTAVGLPRQIVSFGAGYAFGLGAGTGLSLLATLAGAMSAFYYAQFMGRALILKYFGKRLRHLERFLASNTVATILVLRLSPFSSNLATNLAGGVLGIKPLPFFLASVLGYLPQTLIFAMLGSGFKFAPGTRTSLGIGLFLASLLMGAWLWRRYKRSINSY